MIMARRRSLQASVQSQECREATSICGQPRGSVMALRSLTMQPGPLRHHCLMVWLHQGLHRC